MMKAIESYDPGEIETLVVRKGAKLNYERKPTSWAGWIWCTAANGKSAWVPESWVELAGEHCLFSRDYNSRELSIEKGDALELEFEVSGWAWVRNAEGECGWIPADRIGPDQEAAA